MEHIIGAMLLPVFIIVVLAGMAGVKPDFLLKPILDLVAVVLKLLVETIGMVIRLLGEAVILALVARRLDANAQKPIFGGRPKPQKIKIKVVEDSE